MALRLVIQPDGTYATRELLKAVHRLHIGLDMVIPSGLVTFARLMLSCGRIWNVTCPRVVLRTNEISWGCAKFRARFNIRRLRKRVVVVHVCLRRLQFSPPYRINIVRAFANAIFFMFYAVRCISLFYLYALSNAGPVRTSCFKASSTPTATLLCTFRLLLRSCSAWWNRGLLQCDWYYWFTLLGYEIDYVTIRLFVSYIFPYVLLATDSFGNCNVR